MNNPIHTPLAQSDRSAWLSVWEESSRDESIDVLPNELLEQTESPFNLPPSLSPEIEDERKRINRELQAEVGETLTAAGHSLAQLKKEIGDQPALLARVEETQLLLEQTALAIHELTRHLRPSPLEELGLYQAIVNEADDFKTRTGLPVFVQSGVNLIGLDSAQENVLFRTVQESLANISRHAHATKVQIGFRRQSHGITVSVHDDGTGFASEAPAQGEPVRLAHGEYSIDATPGRGTSVHVHVPFAHQVSALSAA